LGCNSVYEKVDLAALALFILLFIALIAYYPVQFFDFGVHRGCHYSYG
jgi:hypothetical protein